MMAGVWVATRNIEFPEQFDFNDKIKHFIVFFGFSVLMDLASERRPFWFWKGLPLLSYGILIEIMQYFTPEREFSFLDMLADLAGIIVYFLIKSLLVWLDSKRLCKTV